MCKEHSQENKNDTSRENSNRFACPSIKGNNAKQQKHVVVVKIHGKNTEMIWSNWASNNEQLYSDVELGFFLFDLLDEILHSQVIKNTSSIGCKCFESKEKYNFKRETND